MVENSTISSVQNYIDAKRLLLGGASVVVGFSGGSDSTALLIILAELGYQVSAVHFNHHLRGDESDRDEERCRHFCLQARIPFECIDLHVESSRMGSESIEMAARRMRLDYWRSSGSELVALGHHKDDALETCMLNLCRGGNVTSLAGLKPIRAFGNVRVIRPLLCLSRDDITTYLASQHIEPPGYDSSNENDAFKRNQVRHQLLPVLETIAGGRQSLYRSLDNLMIDSEFIESAVPRADVLSPAILVAQPEAIRFRLLRDWMVQACQAHESEAVVPGNAVERILAELEKGGDKPRLIDFDDRFFIRLANDSLELVPKDVEGLKEEVEWNWQENPKLFLETLGIELAIDYVNPEEVCDGAEYFDADSLPPMLVVRGRMDGDVMIPFGGRSPKKLKKLVSDSRLSYLEKQCLVLIEAPGTGIIWVPGVKRAEVGRVDDSTKQVLRLTAVRS